MEETKTTITKEELDQRLRNWAHSVLNATETFSSLSEGMARMYEKDSDVVKGYVGDAKNTSEAINIARKRIDDLKDVTILHKLYNTFELKEDGYLDYLKLLSSIFAYGNLDYESEALKLNKNFKEMLHVRGIEPLIGGKEDAMKVIKGLFQTWAETILMSIRARTLLSMCLVTLEKDGDELAKYDEEARRILARVNMAEENVDRTSEIESLNMVYDGLIDEERAYIKYQNDLLKWVSSEEYAAKACKYDNMIKSRNKNKA